MAVELTYDIKIGNYQIAHLLSCEVRKSANKLADTATINMPGMSYNSALEIESKINRGDKVIISFGYDNDNNQEFQGYVSSIATDDTITIECEDGMFDFRKDIESKQFKDVYIKDIIQEVVDQIGGYSLVVGDGIENVRYDKFTIADATGFDILKKLQDDSKVHIFIKQKELHVHLKYTYKEGDVKYDFEKNVEKSSLKYLQEADKKVLVEMIGIDRKNGKTKVTVGDKGGDKITVHRYNVTDKSSLRKIGEEEIKKYRFTGYEGNITTWLIPYCSYGYSAEIIDQDYENREGIYYVEAVTTVFSKSGGSRKVNLGIKL